MPTVLLAGAFGQHNPGDEALLDAFVQTLSGWEILATSRDPADTVARHPVDAVTPGGAAALTALHRADALVVAGGTLFKHLHPSTDRRPDGLLANAVAAAGLARLRGAHVALVGVGAAPLRGRAAPALARRLGRLAHLVILRDEGSAACLEAAGLDPPFRIGADPAWTVLADQPPVPDRAGTVVALSHLAGTPDDVAAWVAGVLWAMPPTPPVTLLPWQGGPEDRRLASRLAGLLGDRVRVADPPRDIADGARIIARHERLLAMRLHAMVAGATAGVPMVAVGHEPKLASLGQRLGCPVVAVGAAPTTVHAALDAAAVDADLSSRVADERARARATLDLLRTYLDGGTAPDARDVPVLDLEPAPWQR